MCTLAMLPPPAAHRVLLAPFRGICRPNACCRPLAPVVHSFVKLLVRVPRLCFASFAALAPSKQQRGKVVEQLSLAPHAAQDQCLMVFFMMVTGVSPTFDVNDYSSLLRLRGGIDGGALFEAHPTGGLQARARGPASEDMRAWDDGDAMADFDIDTLKAPSLPPLPRPRLRRRHGRGGIITSGAKGESKKKVLKKADSDQAAKAVPAGALAAAAAEHAEAWDDAVSHVSTSAGVASHISVSTDGYRQMDMGERAHADKAYATVGSHDAMSGLLESQVGSTTISDEEALNNDADVNVHGKGVGVGDVLNGRFTLMGLLGAGAFGQVFLAEDCVESGHVAIKVQGAGNRQSQVAQDEIALLNVVANCRGRALPPHAEPSRWHAAHMPFLQPLPALSAKGQPRGGDCVVELKGSFALRGPQGKQVCLALEPLGPSLLDLVIDHAYAGCPLPVVANIMRDLLAGLDFLHTQCKIVHTDVKPENVLLRIPPIGGGSASEWWSGNREGWGEVGGDPEKPQRLQRGWSASWPSSKYFRAKLVDLGNACPEARPFTDDIQTIEYRCPEVVIGAGFTSKADLWSAACMAFELITGEYLFDPQEGRDAEGTSVLYERDEDLLALQQELLGPIPLHLAMRGKTSEKLMTEEGHLRRIPSLKFWKLEDVLVDKYCVPREQAQDIAGFLLPMLRYDPEARASAAEMLQHPWLCKHLEGE